MPHFCFRHARFHRYQPCPQCALKAFGRRARGARGAAGGIIGRYIQLRAHPEEINQDRFGVCGMTAVVYVLLRRKPDIVDNLFAATFLDIGGNKGKFSTATKGNHSIDVGSLARGYMKKNPANRELAVDFYLARALGYLLKKTAISRYNSEKADFTKLFDAHQPQDYRSFTRAGELALRTRNVAFILHDIVGAQNVRITKRTPPGLPARAPARAARVKVGGQDMNEVTFADNQELHNQFVNHGPHGNNRNKFALAAVYSDIIRNAGQAIANPPQAPWQLQNAVHIPGRAVGVTLDGVRVLPTRVEVASGGSVDKPFNHWVVIEGYNRRAGHTTELLIWSWGKNFRINVENRRIPSYIRDVIFGEFP